MSIANTKAVCDERSRQELNNLRQKKELDMKDEWCFDGWKWFRKGDSREENNMGKGRGKCGHDRKNLRSFSLDSIMGSSRGERGIP